LNLKGIGRVRARKLYLSGITSIEKLKATDPIEVSRLLGPKIAEKVISQLKKEEHLDDLERNERKELVAIKERKERRGVEGMQGKNGMQERLP
jgi:helicase